MTPRATQRLSDATDIIGYETYLNRLSLAPHQKRHASDNREEIPRSDMAIDLARNGASVAVISGGDPGVFAMAAAVFEALDARDVSEREIEIEIVPGISAVLAAAARIGAPCGNDFCVISLSDNLKPWDTIVHRVEMAARAGFVMAFYNPLSKARPHQLKGVFDHLRGLLAAETPVIFATAISRDDEQITVTTLAEADPHIADMRTLVFIGSEHTRTVDAGGGDVWVYTPRRIDKVSA